MSVCQIQYLDEYKATMAKLRDFLEREVYNEEALELTSNVLELLASHYTTWNYRYNIVVKTKRDLFAELDWCELIALDNEKNYQIWNYRLRIIDAIMADLDLAPKFHVRREFPILRLMLQQDPKNHHVWSYRKWLVERFELHSTPEETEFVEAMLTSDLRNNSAWAHRYFLKVPRPEFDVMAEIAYAKTAIETSPQNASAWNYLLGVYDASTRPVSELRKFCEQFGLPGDSAVRSTFALETLARIAATEQRVRDAAEIYDALGESYDPIRKNYWAWLKGKLDLHETA